MFLILFFSLSVNTKDKGIALKIQYKTYAFFKKQSAEAQEGTRPKMPSMLVLFLK